MRPRPFARLALGLWLALSTVAVLAADFGSPGGPLPSNLDAIGDFLRRDQHDLELLISFGTSKGGSAGHLALAIRASEADGKAGDERVYSANFYADRAPEHASGFYSDELMLAIPKMEYLFGTVSSLADSASFGLDFGEIYKRSVVGIRVYGVARRDKEALAAFFARINDDYRRLADDTEYHDGEVRYDYLRLNCAKTIASAFHFGLGYDDLDISSARILKRRRLVVAAKANIPSETAIKLVRAWDRRGYAMDVVLYRKFAGSSYVDPHDEDKVAFKDLPNRFPSVLSRDFRSEADEYEDYDNLYAMYLLDRMRKYSVRVNEQTRRLELASRPAPLAYPQAAAHAARDARSDSTNFRLLRRFLPRGEKIGEVALKAPEDYSDDPRARLPQAAASPAMERQ